MLDASLSFGAMPAHLTRIYLEECCEDVGVAAWEQHHGQEGAEASIENSAAHQAQRLGRPLPSAAVVGHHVRHAHVGNVVEAETNADNYK